MGTFRLKLLHPFVLEFSNPCQVSRQAPYSSAARHSHDVQKPRLCNSLAASLTQQHMLCMCVWCYEWGLSSCSWLLLQTELSIATNASATPRDNRSRATEL